MVQKNTGNRDENPKDDNWKFPTTIKDAEEELKKDNISKPAKITKDSKGQLLIRFPKQITTQAELKAGEKLEFTVKNKKGEEPEILIKRLKH